MEQHPQDYADTCAECAQFESCGPSMCQKLNNLESELREVKMMLQQLLEKAQYYYGI